MFDHAIAALLHQATRASHTLTDNLDNTVAANKKGQRNAGPCEDSTQVTEFDSIFQTVRVIRGRYRQ